MIGALALLITTAIPCKYCNINLTFMENIVAMALSEVICSAGSNFPGPRNITRTEGSERELILCQSYPIQATPFWKINGTIYYYSDVPPPLVASRSGREIIIPVVELTLNGTSFQCFIPSSSGDELSSSTGVLTVIANGKLLTITINLLFCNNNYYYRIFEHTW